MKEYTEFFAGVALSMWEQATIAASRGAASRSHGWTRALNPYLNHDWLPAATGQAYEVWSANCDAWWQGWDKEDERYRGTSVAA